MIPCSLESVNTLESLSLNEPAQMSVGSARAWRLMPPSQPADTKLPLRVAVSGGIGAGKSTFSAALRPFALAFADADEVARRVVAPGTAGLEQIRQRFGEGVIQADGSLDRAALAKIVFTDSSARADLEKITHPRISATVEQILDVPGPGFTVYDIPLLVTSQDAGAYDEVIMVTAPMDERVERLMTRGLSREDAQRRIEAQISDEERRSLATILVENTGSSQDLGQLATLIATQWINI